MTKRIFRTVLFVSSLTLCLGFLLILGVVYQNFSRQMEKELNSEARYLALAVEEGGADALFSLSGQKERITLVSPDGTVLYDNQANPGEMDNHLSREEITEALDTGYGQAKRDSDTLAEKTMYYAIRLKSGDVLRVSSTQDTVMAIVIDLIWPMAGIILAMILFSMLMALYLSRRIVRPINDLDLEHPEKNQAYDEIAPLLTKINRQNKLISQQIGEAKRQQEEFSLITNNMSEGLIVIDHRTDILSCNDSALRLLCTELPQDSASVYYLNRTEPFRHAVEQALAGQHQTLELQMEDRFLRLLANPVGQNGKVEGAVLLLMDVTETVERERLRKEFTANVSHELKTPLTSISGFAEIMKNGFVQPADVEKFAGRIFEEAQRLIQLVEDIIKISQLDEGGLPYEKEPVDLLKLAKTVADRLEEPAKKFGVSFTFAGESVIVDAIEPILEEVIYNLCDNGVKYNRPGGSVTVTVGKNHHQPFVRIKDTGIGIPAYDQNRVFERFYRVDKSRSKAIGGTGLGLSIVKHGAACLGLDIQMHSVPEEGTEFILTWPEQK